MTYANWDWERHYTTQGCCCVVGVDEVGRGAWAGPLVAVAYHFTAVASDILVGDSKQLPPNQRDKLFLQLQAFGSFGIGSASSAEIDALGVQQAQYQAYMRAISQLEIRPDMVLLDGRPWPNAPYPCHAIVGGDAIVASIAAASIMAKVYRDPLMKTTVHEQFPQYGFDEHVGYGTKKHQEAIATYGVTPIHRLSYKPLQQYQKRTD